MHVYAIRPLCRKKVDNAYYLLLKKRKGEQVSVIQINEIGNDIVSLLEKHVPLQSIFEELSKEYEISNEMAEMAATGSERLFTSLLFLMTESRIYWAVSCL